MTTSKITVDEGTTTPLATYDISEDAETKKLSRTVLDDDTGTAIGTVGNPLVVDTGLTPQTDALTDTELRATPVDVDTGLVQGLTDTELRATPVPVSGTVAVTEPVSVDDNGGSLTVDNPTISVIGGGTEAAAQRVTIANDSTGVISVDDNGGSLTVDGPVTNAQLRATPVPIDGTVLATAASTFPVNDDGGSLTVDGPLTDTELRAAPVDVNVASGTVTVAEPVSVDDNGGSLTVDDGGGSLTVDGPLTDTQLRATAVPVSGTVTATGPLTDTQLRATPVPVSMSSDIELGAVELKNGTDDTRATVTAANALKVDGSAVTQPVSGTVTTTPSGTQTVQGVAADGGSLTSNNPVLIAGQDATNVQSIRTDSLGYVGIVYRSTGYVPGDNVSGLGNTPQDTAGNPISMQTFPMYFDGANWDRVRGDQTNGALVNLGVNNDVTVTGTATVTGNKAEDAAAADGDAGLPILGVRNDSAVVRTSTDGDYGMVALDSAGRIGISDLGGAISVDDNGGSLTVDGTVTVSGTATVTGNKAEDSAAASADAGLPILGVRNDSAAAKTDTDGDYSMLATDSAGRVGIADLGGTISIDDGAGSITVDGSVTANAGTNLNTSALLTEADYDTKAGSLTETAPATDTASSGLNGRLQRIAQRLTSLIALLPGSLGQKAMSASLAVVVASDQSAIPASQSGTWTVQPGNTANTTAWKVDGSAVTQPVSLPSDVAIADDAAFTVATSKVVGSGHMADETSTDSVDEGDIGIGRMTLDRKAIVSTQPHTQGGLLIAKNLDVDETEDAVKTSRGQVYGWYFANRATSVRYIKFYNDTVANVVVGTTVPVITIPIPGNSTDVVAANALGSMGIEFDTAITIAATTGFADNDSGAPGTNDVIANVFYK